MICCLKKPILNKKTQVKYKGNHMQAQHSKTPEKNKAKGKYQKAAGG